MPINFVVASGRLAYATQYPNITGNPRSKFSIRQVVDGTGTFFNNSAFSDPGDQIPGNAPRYNPDLRGDGVHNLDATIFKNLKLHESMTLQFRGEFANFTNTPRFGNYPQAYGTGVTSFGSPTFGQIITQVNSPRSITLGLKFLF